MIKETDILLVGKVNKTHGVKGELSISFYSDDLLDSIAEDNTLIMDMDGIFTPFFVASVRPRSNEALLVTFDDVDSQEDASQFVGKNVYMLCDDVCDNGVEDDEGGFYAAQLIGYKALLTDGTEIGEIIDIDDATDNVLFVVENGDDEEYIPVVDEFITEISTKDHTITFDLPEGLLQN